MMERLVVPGMTKDCKMRFRGAERQKKSTTAWPCPASVSVPAAASVGARLRPSGFGASLKEIAVQGELALRAGDFVWYCFALGDTWKDPGFSYVPMRPFTK